MNNKPTQEDSSRIGKRRWLRWLAVLFAIWLIGDFAHSRYVGRQVRQWEASVPWTEDGLAPDAVEQDWGAPDAETGFLLVHGFSDSPQLYRKMGPKLEQEGFYARAILLPGFGRDLESYANSKTEQWLEKLENEIALLRSRHSKVWIVAHSLGGALTIQHVLRSTNGTTTEVDGIVLIAPAIQVSDVRSPLLPTRFWHEFSKWTLPFSHTLSSPFSMDVRDEEEKDRPHRNTFSPRSIVDQTFLLADANRGQAGKLTLPCLVFLAQEDQVVDSPAIADYYEQLGSSRKKLVVLENSGHVIPIDLEWQEVTRQIVEFVGQGRAEPSKAP